jgi:hypothetical protein
MERHDVERIVRGVLSDLAAPFKLVVVERTASGWNTTLRETPGRVIRLGLQDGPPSAIRATVAQCIEAQP